jgi:hypothetical protein
MEILQIVPGLPPTISGVGDYTFILAQKLRKEHGIKTQFVVCEPNWKNVEILKAEMLKSEFRSPVSDLRPPTRLDGFPVHQLREQSAGELLRVLSLPGMPTTVLLHYVGYGYEKRGCPVWLVRGLEKWRKQKAESRNQSGNQPGEIGGLMECGTVSTGQAISQAKEVGGQKPNPISDVSVSAFSFSAERRLVTMFHELYAFGPPWRSSFWTSPLQSWIAKTLARRSEQRITNRAASATWLAAASHHPMNAISALPVFSNVGEPEELPDWEERPPRLIVFGSASQRRKVYFECKADLEKVCQAMGLNEIVDIGAPFEIPPLSVRLTQRGILSAQAVSREMLAARTGFFAYPAPFLGKSTIFAAYAAHGLVPVTFSANRAGNEDGLKAGEHYLFASEARGDGAGTIARNAHGWYQAHDTKAQAGCYANRIQLLAYNR